MHDTDLRRDLPRDDDLPEQRTERLSEIVDAGARDWLAAAFWGRAD